jgi:hypothetical protein
MMRKPTLAAIYAAELRVAQSKRNTRDSWRRVQAALRATLARPATWALVVGAGGLFGMWLARRLHTKPASAGGSVATTTSAAGLVSAFIGRYVMRRLLLGLRQVWAARQKNAARAGPDYAG